MTYTTTKYLSTTMIMVSLLGMGLTMSAFADTAVANYNGAWDSNGNSVSSVGGTTDIDTLSNGFFYDEGEGRLNLGSTGTACTAPDGKVTVSSEQLRVQVDFSGNQELLESGFGADTHTESGAIVYGGNGGCTFQFKVTTIQHSPYDSGFFDIDTTTGSTFTGTYYVGSTVFASSYGSFGTTSSDVDATINSVSITGV